MSIDYTGSELDNLYEACKFCAMDSKEEERIVAVIRKLIDFIREEDNDDILRPTRRTVGFTTEGEVRG